MAYNKKSTSSVGVVTFDDINKQLASTSPWGSMMNDDTTSSVKDYLNTGNYILNAAFSGSILKGIPTNRTIVLSGESSTGKTYLLLNICREAQKAGYFVVYYDSENAVDPEIAQSFGIDLNSIRYEPVATVQQFRTSITALTEYLIEQKKAGKEIPRILFALDSAGNLASDKEVEDAASGSDKVDMTRSKVLKSLFRILMVRMGYLGSTLICTNHIYKTLDLFSKNVQSGGCLVAGTKVKLWNGDEINIEDVKIGDALKGMKGTPNEVTQTYTFHKPCVKVTFDDGTSMIVSNTHKFAIKESPNPVSTEDWVNANASIGKDVYCIE